MLAPPLSFLRVTEDESLFSKRFLRLGYCVEWLLADELLLLPVKFMPGTGMPRYGLRVVLALFITPELP